MRHVAIGDFNSDGKPDLVGVSGDSENRDIQVLMNAGGGTFPVGTPYMTSDVATGGVAAGDFNGDGKDDFAVLAYTGHGSEALVFINKGDGTFDSNRVKAYATSSLSPVDIIAADVNADGKLDLVAGTSGVGAGYVDVLMGNGDGTFATTKESSAGQLYSIAVADFLGNGRLGVAGLEASNGENIDLFLPTCN
jgi:hypothetical protein